MKRLLVGVPSADGRHSGVADQAIAERTPPIASSRRPTPGYGAHLRSLPAPHRPGFER